MPKKNQTEAKTPELNTLKINVEVALTDQEKIDKGIELVDKLVEIHDVQTEAKDTAKSYKDRIGGLEDEKDGIAQIMRAGKEHRLLEAVKERDDDLFQYMYLEVVDGKKTDNVLKVEPYTAEDHQLPIPEGETETAGAE